MARRRLQAILATTVITVGLSSGPALGQELAGLTETLEETVTSTTEEVATAAEEVASTTEQVVGTVTEGLAEQPATTSEPTDEASAQEDTSGDAAEEVETEDDALIDLGTGDDTLDVELDVDLAPSDEDGSPQLEIDGGLTVGGEHVDVGGLTDPIEDAIDPDHSPDEDGSSDETVAFSDDGSGGRIPDGGVVAAGDSPRPATTDTTGSPTSASGGQGFTSFSLANGGGDSFGLQRFGGGTMDVDAVADPEVAPPAAAPGDAGFDEFPEAPEVAEGSGDATPTVLATQAPVGDDSPLAALLRALAGALVLATGAAWTRATRDA